MGDKICTYINKLIVACANNYYDNFIGYGRVGSWVTGTEFL